MYFRINYGYYDHKLNEYIVNSIEEKNEAKNIINEFPEFTNLNEYNDIIQVLSPDEYAYYFIDIKFTRKLRLLSLNDDVIKQKMIRLETLLCNEKLITLMEDRPSSGTSGSSGTNCSSGTNGITNIEVILSIPLPEPPESFIEKFRRLYFSIEKEELIV